MEVGDHEGHAHGDVQPRGLVLPPADASHPRGQPHHRQDHPPLFQQQPGNPGSPQTHRAPTMPSLSPSLGRGESPHMVTWALTAPPRRFKSWNPNCHSASGNPIAPVSAVLCCRGWGWGVGGGEQPFPDTPSRGVCGLLKPQDKPLLSPLHMPSLTSAPILTPDPKPFLRVKKGADSREAKGLAAFLERPGGENSGNKGEMTLLLLF